jgi:hypothetical protein
MQYLLMCCFDESRWSSLPESERADVMRAYGRFHAAIVESGHYRGGAKLCVSSAATTVRQRSGKAVITDGPFAETKEQLGGYHLVECGNLDEALSIAMRIPTLRVGGTVEVRPLDAALDATS